MAIGPVDHPVVLEWGRGSGLRRPWSTRCSSRGRLRALKIRDGSLKLGEAGLQIRLPGAEVVEVRGLRLYLLRHGRDEGAVGVDGGLDLGGVLAHGVEVLLERWIHGREEIATIHSVATSFWIFFFWVVNLVGIEGL